MDQAGFAVVTGERLVTVGAAAVAGRSLRLGGGLAGQGLGEHLLRQDVAQLQQQSFDLGQLGSPARPVGAVELVHEVFGDPLDIGPHFFYLRGALFGCRHR